MQTLINDVLADPALNWLLTVLVKSVLLLGLTALLALSLRRTVSSAAAHLIWLSGLIATAAIPLFQLLRDVAPTSITPADGIALLTITAGHVGNVSSRGSELFTSGLVSLYAAIAVAGLAVLAFAYWKLRELDSSATPCLDPTANEDFVRCAQQLGIKNKVTLKTSSRIASPVSYGLRNAVVLLPSTAAEWSRETRVQVMTHELAHIARRDWLTLLFSKFICVLLWANPLVWFASKYLHDESEQACDSIVAATDNNRINYAENLLMLAKQRKQQRNEHWQTVLAQPMYSKHSLTVRITNILEGKLVAQVSRSLKIMAATIVSIASILYSSVQLFAADSGLSDRDYLPIHAVSPMYPTRAAEEGVEGWLLLSFTVRADGTVDANSLEILDAEPPGYFEHNSRSAALRFEFEPRIVDGLAVDVPGVEYLFRYRLQEGSTDFGRQPPAANR